MSSLGSGWSISPRAQRRTNRAISTLAIAALLGLSTVGTAPSAFAANTPRLQPTPKVSVRAAEDDKDALDTEEETDVASDEDAQNGEADADAEGSANAELPEEGSYTCVQPGEHYLAASLVDKLPRVVFNDQTVTPHKERENFSVVVPVPDKAKRRVDATDIEAGFAVVAPPETVLWTLPQQANPDYAWINLDTRNWDYSRTSDEGVRFSVKYFEGPGNMKMWMHSAENGVQLLVDAQRKEETGIITKEAGVINLATSFDAAGFYELDYSFKGFSSSVETTRVHNALFTMYYAVGDDMIRKVCGESFIPAMNTEQPADDSMNSSGELQPDNAGASSSESDQKLSETPGFIDAVINVLFPKEKEDSSAERGTSSSPDSETATERTAGSHSAAATATTAPNSTAEQPAAPSTTTPATNVTTEGVEALGNTTHGKVTAKNNAGAQKQQVNQQNKAAGQNTQNASSAPSTEQPSSGVIAGQNANASTGVPSATADQSCEAVVITREAEPSDMQEIKESGAQAGVAKTTLTFSVGDGASGNATDGHFDLGPIVENGTVYARVKDDRTQPAQWFDPSQMIFALGSASAISAPDALDFVATPGKTVWMIQQSQQTNVPWVGMNSQHESILSNTTGEVTFTLESVDGPGKVAVFESGAFGSGIGRVLFSGAGTSYTLPANTHAHQNWVFTEPGQYTLGLSMAVTGANGEIKGSGVNASGLIVTGETGPNGRPMVQQTVGRTADGHDCDLYAVSGANNGGKHKGNGSLAKTGTMTVLPVAIALLVAGTALRLQRKRSE